MKNAFRLAAFALLLLPPATAGAFVIDGDLSDWGVHPGPFGSSDWVPNAGIQWVEEDQITNYLGPGYGGQKFDAEAMYTLSDPNYMYLAVVTGHPPWGAKGWKPGDVAITFTGSPGSNQFGLRTISGSGLLKGGVYRTQPWQWGSGLWGAASDPTHIKGSPSHLGQASFAYKKQSNFSANGKHYIIEAKIPTSYFGSYWGGSYKLHWTQTCGNDAIDLTGSGSSPPVIPEPSTLLLLGLGLAGLGLSHHRRKRAAAAADAIGAPAARS